MGAKNSKDKENNEDKRKETGKLSETTSYSTARSKSLKSVSNVSTAQGRKEGTSKTIEENSYTTARTKTLLTGQVTTRHARNSQHVTYRRAYDEVTTRHTRNSQHVTCRRTYDEGSVQDGNITIFRSEKQNKLAVMAIDFGTTFTGCGYSLFTEPGQVYVNVLERTQDRVPTIVLLDDKRNFHSFGNEAREKYFELIQKGLHKKWYYFEHFKMKLFFQEGLLDVNLELNDMTDKKMKAIDIFAVAISYLKEQFLETVHNYLKEEDVHFILTVPAIWGDLSKRFMRQAAIQAGIPDEALSLALEPEVASLYCKENLKGVKITPGTRYIIADLGGGTADFTCHEVNPDRSLKELQKASGGDHGGTTVDHAFRRILNAIFGADIIKSFKESNMEEFYKLWTHFEFKKRNFQGKDKITLQFPPNLLLKYEEEVGMTVENSVRSSPYRGRVEFKQDKMVIQLELAKEIFNEAISKIVEKTTDLFKEVDNLHAIVLVGGFSESEFLRNTMLEIFKKRGIRVLWPKDPVSAVIKGALIYGHQPRAIDSRVCKYTYGIGRMMKFKPYHPPHKLVDINGVAWCDDLFNKHIEIGQTVRVDDDSPEAEYFPVTEKMKHGVLMVYASSEKNPKFIDEEGCQLIGLVRLELTGGDVNSKVLVRLIFGGTELKVEAVEEKTGKTTVGHIDFLG